MPEIRPTSAQTASLAGRRAGLALTAFEMPRDKQRLVLGSRQAFTKNGVPETDGSGMTLTILPNAIAFTDPGKWLSTNPEAESDSGADRL